MLLWDKLQETQRCLLVLHENIVSNLSNTFPASSYSVIQETCAWITMFSQKWQIFSLKGFCLQLLLLYNVSLAYVAAQ